MNDDIGAVLDRTQIDGTGERRVHDQRNARFLGDVTHGPQIEDAAGRIHGRLEKDRTRVLAQVTAPDTRLERIDERDFDAERAELTAQQRADAAVDPRAREQMIAWPEQR